MEVLTVHILSIAVTGSQATDKISVDIKFGERDGRGRYL